MYVAAILKVKGRNVVTTSADNTHLPGGAPQPGPEVDRLTGPVGGGRGSGGGDLGR